MTTEDTARRLRTIGDDFPPVKSSKVTLIRVATDGRLFATSPENKTALLSLPGDATYMAVWTGQHRSDVFDVTPAVRQRWAMTLGSQEQSQ
jgi:hypothetical protein